MLLVEVPKEFRDVEGEFLVFRFYEDFAVAFKERLVGREGHFGVFGGRIMCVMGGDKTKFKNGKSL